MTKTSSGYSRTQIILHWAIALLILFQFVGSGTIADLVEQVGLSASSSESIPLLARAHVLAGLLTFVLMLVRVLIRTTRGVPALPKEESPIMKILAHTTHGILYLSLFLMPISGALAWFRQIELADSAHLALKFVLLGFVVLHIAGALYHQFVLKNGLIKRIIKAG
ncbi:MAG: cytochrome b/b6 domain-containing protein [Rhodobacteraceae bacterium]|nr:cytochrome b/b6 domain-containing protein [Paracoccaceae bacterium]